MDIPIRENCFLIAFEGADQLGKTTQSRRLYEHLRSSQKGIDVKYLSFPNVHYMYGPTIYRMLAAKDHEMHNAKVNPDIFQAFCSANKMHAQVEFATKGKRAIIVLDRWKASSYVYGKASGVYSAKLNLTCEDLHNADIEFVFEGEPFQKDSKDIYEKDNEFQKRVRRGYREYCESTSPETIDSQQPQDDIFRKIVETTKPLLQNYLERHGRL